MNGIHQIHEKHSVQLYILINRDKLNFYQTLCIMSKRVTS